MRKQQRWFELLLLYLMLPVAVIYWLREHDQYLMPLLFVMGTVCFYLLLTDKKFKRFRLWHTEGFSRHFRSALTFFVPGALVIALLLYFSAPEVFLALPSDRWQLWLVTLAIYPFVSVIPQELIFRTFFFHRYKRIIPSKAVRLMISSLSFALAHLVYGNWIAVLVSGLGGLLFGYRYLTSRSTLVVIVEHTLWGSFLFTIGIGVFFLTQAAQA